MLQLNSSSNYYTSGENDIILIKIGSNRTLLLDYTYFINRNIIQNYTTDESTINDNNLERVLNNTSNEYTLQGVSNVNGFLGVITELPQVFLAIYDTDIIPFSYPGSDDIDITDNQISFNFPTKINDEIVLHPRAYDGAVFDMLPGTGNFAFT